MTVAVVPGASAPGAPGVGSTEVEDALLVAQMARGDQKALSELYQRRSRDVYMVVMAVLRDSSQVADVMQEVFLEAWRGAERYDAARGTVRAWLKMRARSRAIDRIRRHRHFEALDSPEASSLQASEGGGSDAAPSSERRAARMDLPAAFQALNQAEQDVVGLGYVEGLSSAEIAARLGIPAGTVKSRTRTAMVKLRGYWNGAADDA